VRLDLPEMRGADALETRHAVGRPATVELLEAWDLRGGRGDDDLAAEFVADVVLLAEAEQQLHSTATGRCLEGTRTVVQSGVNDAAVPAGLVRGDPILLVEEDDVESRTPDQHLEGGGQRHDPGADDDEVVHPCQSTSSPPNAARPRPAGS
jgi:hypothetical protein